ncbi:hypothetical protein ACA910_015097 [Epithemia clementina (nom. ined.)]
MTIFFQQQKKLFAAVLLLTTITCGALGSGVKTHTRVLSIKGSSSPLKIALAEDSNVPKVVQEGEVNDSKDEEANADRFCFRDNFLHHGQRNSQSCVVPQVPVQLFFKKPLCRKMPCSKRESCMLVAENILAHFGSAFDMVFLAGEVCQDKFHLGNLTMDTLRNILPNDEKLVGLSLNGTDLVEAVEHGLSKVENNASQCRFGPKANGSDHFPIVAGVKFGVEDPAAVDKTFPTTIMSGHQPQGTRIKDVMVLSPHCSWKPIDLRASYSVLTTESMAFGKWGYSALARSYGYWDTGRTLRNVFWEQALTTCSVEQPVNHFLEQTSTIAVSPKKAKQETSMSPTTGSTRTSSTGTTHNHEADDGTIIRLSALEVNSSITISRWVRTSSAS